jgi:hypothetical protein
MNKYKKNSSDEDVVELSATWILLKFNIKLAAFVKVVLDTFVIVSLDMSERLVFFNKRLDIS